MADITVYEKRTCTTCRNLAALLTERGIDFEAVDFHLEPLTAEELRALVAKTGVPARELFRTREPVYRDLGLGDREVADDEAIALMAEHPQLLERPVVVRGDRAVLARPVERVLELL
ncbi:MAG: arsenate reductase family protein [Solirubrobacteraceae bacterium]